MNARPLVGLNAQLLSGAASYRSAGIHQYIDRLVHYLPAFSDQVEFIIFANRQARLPAEKARVRVTAWPTHRPLARIVWEQLAQPLWARLEDLELLHGLAFVLPVIRQCPTVVTVYDLSFAYFPAWFQGANAAYLRLFTRLSCQTASRVIAISESTRRAVMRLYGVPAERVDVALPGVDAAFCTLPQDQVEAFRRERNLPDTFILHVGTLEPRKNHLALLKAFAQLLAFDLPCPTLQLVCVGGNGWLYDEIYAAVERLNLQERVTFAGYTPAHELPLWYNAAALFVYPSLYEGFGMPVLEAMACGAPVITSNVSSLPQAAGDAGLLVSPESTDELAAAMRQLLANVDLRRQLSEAGKAHAAEFRWERTAQQTMSAYRNVLKSIP